MRQRSTAPLLRSFWSIWKASAGRRIKSSPPGRLLKVILLAGGRLAGRESCKNFQRVGEPSSARPPRFPLAPVNQAVAAFLPGRYRQSPPPFRRHVQNAQRNRQAPNSLSPAFAYPAIATVIRLDVPSNEESRPMMSPIARMPFMAFVRVCLTREVIEDVAAQSVSSEPARPPARLEPILSRAMPAIARTRAGGHKFVLWPPRQH